MKILVTGGAGFIASHIVDSYILEGHHVIIFDDLSTGIKKNINPKAEFHEVDIRSQQAFEKLVEIQPEIINHHAAQVDLRKSVENPLEDASINILGLLNLMQAAVKSQSVKKTIFASTGGAIYGDADTIPTQEDYPAWPVSPYGIAKLTCEHYLYYYQKTFNIPFVSLRYGNVYGPRQNPHGEAGVVAIFARKMLDGEQVIINGNGKQTRDFVFVADVVEANRLVIRNQFSGIFNIGTGEETDVNDIFFHLSKILGSSNKAKYGPEKKGEQKRSALECSKAKEVFSWEAHTSIEEGIKKTAEFFKNQ